MENYRNYLENKIKMAMSEYTTLSNEDNNAYIVSHLKMLMAEINKDNDDTSN